MNKRLRIALSLAIAVGVSAAQFAWCCAPLWPAAGAVIAGGLLAAFAGILALVYEPRPRPRPNPKPNYANLKEGVLT